MAQEELLAALLAFRAIYCLAPLALASMVFFVVEARARKSGKADGSPGVSAGT